MPQTAPHHVVPKGLAARLTPDEITHYQAGRLEQISVRPLLGTVPVESRALVRQDVNDALALARAGKFDEISVRPLHSRVAAVLYDIGERVWNFCAIPWRWIDGTLERDMARKAGVEGPKPTKP